MKNAILTHEILLKLGFEHGNDNGHTCDYNIGVFFLCSGVDEVTGKDYYIEDKTGVRVHTTHELKKVYDEYHLTNPL